MYTIEIPPLFDSGFYHHCSCKHINGTLWLRFSVCSVGYFFRSVQYNCTVYWYFLSKYCSLLSVLGLLSSHRKWARHFITHLKSIDKPWTCWPSYVPLMSVSQTGWDTSFISATTQAAFSNRKHPFCFRISRINIPSKPFVVLFIYIFIYVLLVINVHSSIFSF